MTCVNTGRKKRDRAVPAELGALKEQMQQLQSVQARLAPNESHVSGRVQAALPAEGPLPVVLAVQQTSDELEAFLLVSPDSPVHPQGGGQRQLSVRARSALNGKPGGQSTIGW